MSANFNSLVLMIGLAGVVEFFIALISFVAACLMRARGGARMRVVCALCACV